MKLPGKMTDGLVHRSPPQQAPGGGALAQGGASRLRPVPDRSSMPVQGCDEGGAATDGTGANVAGAAAKASRRARGAGGQCARGFVVGPTPVNMYR